MGQRCPFIRRPEAVGRAVLGPLLWRAQRHPSPCLDPVDPPSGLKSKRVRKAGQRAPAPWAQQATLWVTTERPPFPEALTGRTVAVMARWFARGRRPRGEPHTGGCPRRGVPNTAGIRGQCRLPYPFPTRTSPQAPKRPGRRRATTGNAIDRVPDHLCI